MTRARNDVPCLDVDRPITNELLLFLELYPKSYGLTKLKAESLFKTEFSGSTVKLSQHTQKCCPRTTISSSNVDSDRPTYSSV